MVLMIIIFQKERHIVDGNLKLTFIINIWTNGSNMYIVHFQRNCFIGIAKKLILMTLDEQKIFPKKYNSSFLWKDNCVSFPGKNKKKNDFLWLYNNLFITVNDQYKSINWKSNNLLFLMIIFKNKTTFNHHIYSVSKSHQYTTARIILLCILVLCIKPGLLYMENTCTTPQYYIIIYYQFINKLKGKILPCITRKKSTK